MNWELIVAIAAFVVSLGALIFSAYTYSKHDKKIKAQEQIINDYQINKIAKENEENKKLQFEEISLKVRGVRELLKCITVVRLRLVIFVWRDLNVMESLLCKKIYSPMS